MECYKPRKIQHSWCKKKKDQVSYCVPQALILTGVDCSSKPQATSVQKPNDEKHVLLF